MFGLDFERGIPHKRFVSFTLLVRIRLILSLLLIGWPAYSAFGGESFGSLSLSELEKKRAEIDDRLGQLAHLSLRGGMGTSGFRSVVFDSPGNSYWLQIELEETCMIDQVILVPVLMRGRDQDEVVADAFPEALRVIVGDGDDSKGEVVAEYTVDDHLLPRIAPLVVSFSERPASWVRIEATQLSESRVRMRDYVFQVAEIMVFSGYENVALHRPISVSGKQEVVDSIRFRENQVTDGSIPYSMDTGDSEQHFPLVLPIDQYPDLFIDFGETRRFSRVRLHAVEQSNQIPQSRISNFGMPQHFQIFGADSADFSDERLLLDYRWESIYQVAPIMEWRISESDCRYVRFHTVEPSPAFRVAGDDAHLGFAEMEFLAGKENVALGGRAWVSDFTETDRGAVSPFRHPSALTDGFNRFGKILSNREWLGQLALRHDLGRDLIEVNRLISLKFDEQKRTIFWTKLIVVMLLLIVGLITCLSFVMRRRHETRIRERIAANLHDELGANLHAIGILGDLAAESVDDRTELIETLDRIRSVTERTGLAAYRCANLMNAEGFCSDLVAEMRQEADRLLRDVEFRFDIRGEGALKNLKPRKRVDIFLFFKECLVNAIRHAQASTVEISVNAEPGQVRLVVEDDGIGLEGDRPRALVRRAKLLKGKLRFLKSCGNKGLRVELLFKP